jgi:phage baseplate assembly protein W
MWEPRIRVLDIVPRTESSTPERLDIEIEYEIKATHDRRSLVFPFYRIPGE